MISKIASVLAWYRQTALLVGLVLLPWFLFLLGIKSLAEVTCKLSGSACQYSWSYSVEDELLRAMEEEGRDVVIKPRK